MPCFHVSEGVEFFCPFLKLPKNLRSGRLLCGHLRHGVGRSVGSDAGHLGFRRAHLFVRLGGPAAMPGGGRHPINRGGPGSGARRPGNNKISLDSGQIFADFFV